jgi:hypothetical protein
MRVFILALAGAMLSGCAGLPADALEMTPDTLERRQIESRRFAGAKPGDIMAACAGVAQDLGFNIDESEPKLGVIVASKRREASSGGARFAMALLAGANAANSMDRSQTIRVGIVAKPAPGQEAKPNADWVVRATFQRVVINSYGQVTRLEWLNEEELHQQFFEKLSKAVFLEAQKI